MIDQFRRMPAHRRIVYVAWLLNAVLIAGLLAFALRGAGGP